MTSVDLRPRFHTVWSAALREPALDPKGALGDLMTLIEECLEVEQIQYNEGPKAISFLFDLSPLGFSGMDYNVLVVSLPPSNEEEARRQAVFLSEQKYAAETLGFAFHLYLSNEPVPRNPFVQSAVDPVFLCGRDLERLLTDAIPKMALAAIIRQQTPLHRLCPFSTSVEASGAMFRGRSSELRLLVEGLKRCVAIAGARRIGKTSLMKRAYNILRTRLPDGRQRVFYFNALSWSTFWHCCWMLAHKIDPKREPRLDKGELNVWYMLERCSHHGTRPLYLFFDEVDGLIDFDAANGWKFFNLLAAARDAGFIRFVVAGYRSIARLVFGQSGARSGIQQAGTGLPKADTPLLLAMEYLELSPLSRKDADSLLTEPVRGVEMRFENERAVLDRVWKNTIGYPFLVQFFGQRLFKMGSEKNPQQIEIEDVEAVEHSSELREFLETHFIENTLDKGSPAPNERACALLLAHSDNQSWTEQDFLVNCLGQSVSLGSDEMSAIHRAVKNLHHAQVFSETNGKYSFTFPMMRQVLRESYPNLLSAIQLLCRR